MITFRRLGHLGRFGNQLFQYSGTRLYAELNGFSWNMSGWSGESIFQQVRSKNGEWRSTDLLHSLLLPTVQLADIKATSWRERLFRTFGLWRRGSIEELYRAPQDNVNLYGYLQDEFSLAKLKEHRNRLRSWFRFRPEVDSVLRAATEKYRPWTAVHVRRGDLVLRGVAVPVSEYLDLLPKVCGQRNVFVATDDPSVTKEFSAFCPFDIRHSDFDIPASAVDFWMLKESDVLLAGGSTFSWWAAYLGNADYYSPPLTHTWPTGYVPKLEKQSI